MKLHLCKRGKIGWRYKIKTTTKNKSSFFPTNNDSRLFVAIWIAASSVLLMSPTVHNLQIILNSNLSGAHGAHKHRYATRTWQTTTKFRARPRTTHRDSLFLSPIHQFNSNTLHIYSDFNRWRKKSHSLRSNVEEPNYNFAMAFSMLRFEHSYLKTYWTRFGNVSTRLLFI